MRTPANVSHRVSPNARTVVMSMERTRTPVSVSIRVRSSRLPSESKPYSEIARSGSTDLRKIRLSCSATRRRTNVGHSSRAALCSSARKLLVSIGRSALAWNASANGLRRARSVNHGVPIDGA